MNTQVTIYVFDTEISTAVHIQLGEDASENSTLVAKPKGPTTKKGKHFRVVIIILTSNI